MVDFKNNLLKSLWQPAKAPSPQRLPACKGSQPAKAPSLQRLTHGKDHAVHAKVADKAAAAKGLWSCGGRATWCGWSRKNIAAKVAQTHMRMTMSQHAHTHKQHTAYTKPKQKLHTHTHATLTQTHATTHTTKTQMHRAYKIQTWST